MKFLLIAALFVLLVVVSAMGATGNKPNQQVLRFHTISSSTHSAPCVRGEQRMDASNVFTCISASGHWRKQALGNSF